MFSASNIHYQLADRSSGIACGGIGLVQMLARRTDLIEALDRNLHLLKLHLPYHESDHVLNLAYNGKWGYHPLVVSLATRGTAPAAVST